jgi:hypothetical protein
VVWWKKKQFGYKCNRVAYKSNKKTIIKIEIDW